MKKSNVLQSRELTKLAHSVGLPGSEYRVPFHVTKRKIAIALAHQRGETFKHVDDYLAGFPGVKITGSGGKRRTATKTKKATAIDHSEAVDVFLSVLSESDENTKTKIPCPTKKIHKNYSGAEFLKSKEWQELRYLAIKTHGRVCMCCGAAGLMHVDHIKPRSRHPALELDIRNLQILCEACNLGKGAWDETDWRTEAQKAVANRVHMGFAIATNEGA